MSLPLLAPPPPFPPLLELQLRPNFLRRSTLFAHSPDFFASRPPGDGGTSCPAASTAGETTSSAVAGDAVPTDVSPENLRTNLRRMKHEPRLDADGGRAKPAVSRGVSSTVMGIAVASDARGVGVVGEEGKMCSSGRGYTAGRSWGTAMPPALAVVLAGVVDEAALVVLAELWAPPSASGSIYRLSSGSGLRDAARKLGPDGPPKLGGVVSHKSTNSASSSESPKSENKLPPSWSCCDTPMAGVDRTVPTSSV